MGEGKTKQGKKTGDPGKTEKTNGGLDGQLIMCVKIEKRES